MDKLFKLRLDDAEQAVNREKEKTTKKVEQVTVTLKEAGKLQKKVLQKTTTYYLAKAAGVIK